MRESILTIPVNEVFEPKEGCPICRMRDTVEQHIAEYIMGAAMMEPDVREETNKLGFCKTHFGHLLKQNNRLSLGLMLNSYLEKARSETFENRSLFSGREAKSRKTGAMEKSCFVCEKTNWGISHMLKTVYELFRTEREFRTLFSGQEFICIPHYNLLCSNAGKSLSKSDLTNFLKALDLLVGEYMMRLNSDVNDFCNSFDYRNAGKLHTPEMEHVRTSVTRAIAFLTGRPADDK